MRCVAGNNCESVAGEPYLYRAYGLVIQSRIPCPELHAVSGEVPQVLVGRGPVPDSLPVVRERGFKFEANRNQVLIKTDTIAKILVSEGSEILVEPRDGAGEADVRLLLLGWGFGALLHQRDILPLHASAVAVEDGCVAFCAPSGTGKSTTAAHLVQRGYRLMDDNIVALRMEADTPMAAPGYPELKLVGHALREWERRALSSRYASERKGGKSALYIGDLFESKPRILRRLYVLFRGASRDFDISPLKGASLFHALAQNTFCARFARAMGKGADHFEALKRLARAVPVYSAAIPARDFPPREVARRLEAHFSG